ncbi:MAG: ceramidase [Methylobacillus sp.]|jgi:hypothetical protein|nr:ceramidase [Methylobacillus sp.]
MTTLTPREKILAAAVLLLVLIACFAPSLSAAKWDILDYIDKRAWLGLPNAANVLSNLPFLFLGVWGLFVLRARQRSSRPVGTLWFFIGFILTCFGSSYYHLEPNGIHLIFDRLGMTVAFAGMLGIATGERISARSGRAMTVLITVTGLLAAWIAYTNLTPWAVVQFGGIALILALACIRFLPGTLGVPLGGIIVFYTLAKIMEMNDAAIYRLTHEFVSGHTLKHLFAAMAGLPVIRALDRQMSRA